MMTEPEVRNQVVNDIELAINAGARQKPACTMMGIATTTLRRWKPADAESVLIDQRPTALRPPPSNQLSELERQRILIVCNEPDHSSLPPSQIVPRLADQGIYIASESSFYRVLKSQGQLHHRGRAKAKQTKMPTTHLASKPNDVWMWDITYLPTRTIGRHYYLYMVEDLFSRFGVHWEVHDCESSEFAATLVAQAVLKRCLHGEKPILHSDNGSPMKSFTLRAKMDALGIKPSYSRPRVSNDNPFIESMFRTVKYCPQWPSQGFESLGAAREWVASFTRWYNEEHCHSALRFVTPGQRYRGEDQALLEKRKAVYQAAKDRNPNRWSGNTRNWQPIGNVALNPEKEIPLAA
jgi:putative transposase